MECDTITSSLCPCCVSPAKKVSNEIDEMLLLEKKLRSYEFKVLILGPGESGKSTFLKQMRIIHDKGIPDADRRKYINVVHKNACEGMQIIIEAMKKFGIKFAAACNAEKAAEFVEVHFTLHSKYRERHLEVLEALWEDPGCQECFQLKYRFHLPESANFFLPKLNDILQTDYLPSEQDIVFSRYPTTSVDEYTIEIDYKKIGIVDVGGQICERPKWLNCFENVTAVLFIAAVSEYDQYLHENPNKNRLSESLDLFEVIISASYFQHSSIMLLLNKFDILADKVQYISIKDYFPDFDGREQDVDSAKDYMVQKFQSANRSSERIVYTHFTCATGVVAETMLFFEVKNTQMPP